MVTGVDDEIHKSFRRQSPVTTAIAVFTSHLELGEQAVRLAEKLHLPYTHTAADYDYLLVLTPDYLGIKKTRDASHPFYIDFTAAKLTYRRKQLSLRNEAISRALGLKKNLQPIIVDATAGLARDSFIVAALGFEVILLERSSIIAALLSDALQRALQNEECAPIVKRMRLIHTDAISWLKNAAPKPDLIYLDPMFPERRKSALVKKEMQIFQAIIGEDTDSALLLETALTCANQRVVVKRPRLASELAGPKPSVSLSGSSSRFDIYLT
jgi:16S rRNA (guanine1516-N2)-methyltransferase